MKRNIKEKQKGIEFMKRKRGTNRDMLPKRESVSK